MKVWILEVIHETPKHKFQENIEIFSSKPSVKQILNYVKMSEVELKELLTESRTRLKRNGLEYSLFEYIPKKGE